MRKPRPSYRYSAFRRSPSSIAAFLIATGLGSGLVRYASGTMGSLVALFFCFLAGRDVAVLGALALASLVFGTWAARRYQEVTATKDAGQIVIDEFLGMFLCAMVCGGHTQSLWAAFFLFRFFDVVKFPPARAFDRLSKTSDGWLSAFAVMADDIVAAVQTLVVIFALQWFGWLA